MKEKIFNMIKNPIIIGIFVAVLGMVLCGIFALKKTATNCPDVVVEFCDTLVRYDQEDVIEQLRDTNLIRYGLEKDKIIQQLNERMEKKGIKVSYTLGDVEIIETENSTTQETEYKCHAMLIIRQKGEITEVLNMTFYVAQRKGEETIIDFQCPELGVE